MTENGDLEVLRAELGALRSEVASLRAAAAAVPVSGAIVADPLSTRRGLLRLAGAAAIGAGALLMDGTPVAADNGIVNTNQATTTTLTHSSTTGFHFRGSDSSFAPTSGVIVASTGTSLRHAIRANSENSNSTLFVDNTGIGRAMLVVSQSPGASATIQNPVGPILGLSRTPSKLRPSLRPGEGHNIGDLDVDGDGTLWYCIGFSSGPEPGSWQQLGGPSVAGGFHAIEPIRVYDSRKAAYTPNGLRAPNTSFVASVSDSRNVSTGAVLVSGVVPVGAAAVAYNVTVANTTGPNFLSVAPGDAVALGASSLNWSTSGQAIANAAVSKLDSDRQLKIFMGNQAGSAHVIIDVQGYWL
ncbi:MAG: hypothetical protein ABMA25_10375 [Ilumatobacteraceae bacterium]